jgi:hypothetical protein
VAAVAGAIRAVKIQEAMAVPVEEGQMMHREERERQDKGTMAAVHRLKVLVQAVAAQPQQERPLVLARLLPVAQEELVLQVRYQVHLSRMLVAAEAAVSTKEEETNQEVLVVQGEVVMEEQLTMMFHLSLVQQIEEAAAAGVDSILVQVMQEPQAAPASSSSRIRPPKPRVTPAAARSRHPARVRSARSLLAGRLLHPPRAQRQEL